MENREHFGSLTARMKAFREEVLDEKPYVDAERAILATQAYQENQNQPRVMARALMLKKILEHMTIYIEDKTLLAGNQATKNVNAPIFPEYTMGFVLKELDLFEKRDGDVFYITEETKQQLRDIAPFWENNNLRARGEALLPDEVSVFMETGVFGMEGKLNAGDAHLAVNYPRVLKEGLCGYERRTRACLAALDLTDPDSIDKTMFYKAVLIVIDAVRTFALRYSALAKELAEKQTDAARRAELLEMSRICAKVPYEPADSFREAVQSVWFIQLILQIESNGHSLSYGRFDQYMYPYYRADMQSGRLTREDALELLTCLWIKTLTINKLRSQAHTLSSAGSPMYQNVTIGGQTTDKKDAVNELSFVVLQSVAQTRLTQPNLTVRYHKGLSDDFLAACIQVIRCGFGMPAFNNDEIIIPSFLALGVKKEDAYNYSAIGCVEVAVPGKWGYRCTGMSFVNFPKTLMIALNDGVDVDSGKEIYPGCGHFLQMESFDQVMHAWDTFIREFCRQAVILDSAADMVLEQEVPDVLCSALTEDCIGRGKHLKEGGAIYDFISDLQVGIANLGDSLAAIKKCVYEDQSMTREELWKALMEEFAGPEGERIRKLLLAAPKYGNDNDYVDSLTVQGYNSYIDEIAKYHKTRYGRGPIGGRYYAGTSSISANVPQGAGTCAPPAGRPKGDPLAEGCSPTHAADVNGPTSVFQSVAKLPTDKITGGVLLNQKVAPAMLEKPRDREKLLLLLRTFFDVLHGFHVQYNVVSRETLLDAQVHPEKHRDLIVRVAGYSAFFNVLSRQTQDDIIARTEQVL